MAPSATPEDQLQELGRRIDLLAARVPPRGDETGRGIRGRIAELQKLEASALAAAHTAAASLEENMLELEMRVNMAEQALGEDLAEDQDEFLGALMAELHSWDLYLERLQVKVATKAGDCRDDGEGAIRELRRHRNTLGGHLAEVTSGPATAWRQVRQQVRVARHELESRVAAVEAAVQKGERV
jgi:hypothetical protein